MSASRRARSKTLNLQSPNPKPVRHHALFTESSSRRMHGVSINPGFSVGALIINDMYSIMGPKPYFNYSRAYIRIIEGSGLGNFRTWNLQTCIMRVLSVQSAVLPRSHNTVP